MVRLQRQTLEHWEMPELRTLTQPAFVSQWQMIYDRISSPLITHWCLSLLQCPRWAVCLLCIECAQCLFTVRSLNPALKTDIFILMGFSYDCISGVAQKNGRNEGSSQNFPSAGVWPGNCNDAAVPQSRGKESGIFTHVGEWGKQTKGNSLDCYSSEAHLSHQWNSKPPVQTLHLQFLALV